MAWGTPTSRGTNTDTTGAATNLVISSVSVAQDSLIVVAGCVTVNTALTFTIADSAGNTYAVIQAENTTATPDRTAFIGWAVASAALSNGTVTITYGEVVGSSCAEVFETTGTAPTLDSAVTASSSFASATPSQASGTPSVSGDLMLGVLIWNDTGKAYTEDVGNGWTNLRNQLQVAAPDSNMSAAYQVNAGSGAKTYAPTLSGIATGVVVTAGFKPSLAGVAAQTVGDIAQTASGTHLISGSVSQSIGSFTQVARARSGSAFDPGTQSFVKGRQWKYREVRTRSGGRRR